MMTLESLKNLSREDILGALGLETKRSTGSALAGSMAVFGVGLLVGAAAALLMAPKTGVDLREDVTSRIRNLKNRSQRGQEGENSALT